jgi:hypothetical protein
MALRSVVVKVDLARRMESQGRAAEVKVVAVEVVVVAGAKAADVVDAAAVETVAVVIMAAETEAGDARTVTNVWIDAGSDPA